MMHTTLHLRASSARFTQAFRLNRHLMPNVTASVAASFIALSLSCASMSNFAQTTPVPGSFDTTFGVGGKIVSASSGTDDVAWKIVVQPDGKILAAGHCKVTGRDEMCFARVNANGTLDASFTGPAGNAAGKFSWAPVNGNSFAFGLALQADGKIVVAGNCIGTSENTCVARLNANGSVDTEFGSASGPGPGFVVSELSTSIDKAYDVVIQSDGKIVVGGPCEKDGATPVRTDFCVSRYTTRGVLDDSFGERVVAAQTPRTGTARTSIGGKQDTLMSLALQADGKIVAVGECDDAAGNAQVCVTRLSGTNGTQDSTFVGPFGSTGGKFSLDVGAKGTGYIIRIQSDGKILIGGGCYESLNAAEAFCFTRLNSSGSYDSSFNGPLGDGAGRFLLPIVPRSRIDDFGNGLAIQADGKIVAVGQCDVTVAGASQTSPCVTRMNSDGSLDASFDGTAPTVGNGKFVLSLVDAHHRFETVAIQADGNIVAAGRCVNGGAGNFCLARLNGNTLPTSECRLDIDNDGLHTATIDGLIATRVMLGFRDAAALNGIVFPGNASRTNWTDIREFLVTKCGMTIS